MWVERAGPEDAQQTEERIQCCRCASRCHPVHTRGRNGLEVLKALYRATAGCTALTVTSARRHFGNFVAENQSCKIENDETFDVVGRVREAVESLEASRARLD